MAGTVDRHAPEWVAGMVRNRVPAWAGIRMRLAALRKEQGITQVQLGETLGIAQQMVASYEIGRRRIPVSMLPRLAHALAVPLEALLGVTNGAAKRGPTPKLQQQMERIHRLPKARQKFVMEMLETVLQQTSR